MASLDRDRSIRQFLRGPSRRALSSGSLCWPDMTLERHVTPPGEIKEGSIGTVLLCLWQHTTPSRCDNPNSQGLYVPRLIPPDTLSFYTPGALASVHPHAPCNIVMCAFDREFLAEARDEGKDDGNVRTVTADGSVAEDQLSFSDPAVRSLILNLEAEAGSGGLLGRLYSESLIEALKARLLGLTHTSAQRLQRQQRLPPAKLRKVIERIVDDPLTEIGLSTLAAESGYSRRHFVRMFQAATGRTPHRYVLDIRLERARILMKRRSLSLLEIAYECGFASHAHLTRAFQLRFGMAPSSFRRMLHA